MNLGTVTLKEFLLSFINIGKRLEKDLSDGKITLAEAIASTPTIGPELYRLITLDFSMLAKEWLDMSREEADELGAFVEENLDLTDKTSEMFIESALSAGLALSVEFRKIFGLFKTAKKDPEPAEG